MKRIPYIAFLPIVFLIMIMWKMIDRIDSVGGFVSQLITILVPFIWAFAIAYLANPLLENIEKKSKFNRNISILLVYVIIIGVIVLFVTIAVPSLVQSINDIIADVPEYVKAMEAWSNQQIEFLEKNGGMQYLQSLEISNFDDLIKNATSMFNNVLTGLLSFLVGLGSGLMKFIIGLIISIYMLKEKEIFLKGIKKINYAILPKRYADIAVELVRETHNVFSKYIVGKFIDSLIIGIICFVGLSMIGAPYTLLMSIIVGITNMIPYFGPFIGAVPAVLFTLFVSPVKALFVAIFILALQQVDGYIIGPKILGDSVGMSPFWIILAILVGGGLFGVLGMLIGVPVLAVIRNVVSRWVEDRLETKQLKID